MIGDTLKKAREKQKLSIQDVEQATSIRAVYITALEKGEYDKLPGEVYAKGFIKNYGNFLNLDGEDLVRQFIQEISVASVTDETDNSKKDSNTENKIAAENIGEKYKDSKTASTRNFKTESDSNNYMVAAVALIVILIGGIFYTFSGSNDEVAEVAKVKTQPAAEIQKVTEPQPVAEVTPPAPQAQPVAAPAPPPPVVVTPAFKDITVHATFSADCWTRVVIDGTMLYEGMIGAGESFDWKANQSVSVLLGNAGAAQFMMNGKDIGALGAYGDVVEKDFTL